MDLHIPKRYQGLLAIGSAQTSAHVRLREGLRLLAPPRSPARWGQLAWSCPGIGLGAILASSPWLARMYWGSQEQPGQQRL